MAVPLSDAGSAGVGHNHSADGLEVVDEPIAARGEVNLFRARIDDELSLGLQSLSLCLAGYGSSFCKVLIARVGARADESHLNSHRIVLTRPLGLHLAQRCGSIGSERTIEMGLYAAEVDFDNLVVVFVWVIIYISIGHEVGGNAHGHVGNLIAARLAQIILRIAVEGEYRACGSKLGTHIADCGAACS